MPPNQENNTPEPVNSPSQPTPTQQTVSPQQTPSSLTNGGMKVIQPTGNIVASPENVANTITPQVVVGDHSSPTDTVSPNTAINVPQNSTQIISVYPEPQLGFVSTGSVSRASIEDEANKHKRRKRLVIGLVSLVLVLLAGVSGFLYWYLPQDHSIYAKLTAENYNQNGVNLSFLYPSIMQPDSTELTKLQNQTKDNTTVSDYLFYDYRISTSQRMSINVYSFKIDGILRALNLTPAQLLAQIKAGSGSFVDVLNKKNPQAFTTLYNGCNNSITNNSNQTLVTCYASYSGYTIEQLAGADTNYQYNLTLFMPNAIWNAHPKVWQKVEKSFIY